MPTGADAQHLSDLAWLRRVKDRMDREHAQPLDVEALARGANIHSSFLSHSDPEASLAFMIRIQERP